MKIRWLLPRVIAILIITLLMLEIGVRMKGEITEYGQFIVQGELIPPLSLPIERHRQLVEDYQQNEEIAFIGYDDQTGWGFIPNRVSQGDLFHINSHGFRDNVDYELEPAGDILRIALFGDSFAAGSEVPFESSYVSQLEAMLNGQGIHAEVLTFGVAGYGMDQAYLRWQYLGQNFHPDIVLFAFQPENMNRNINVIRMLYYPQTNIIFSKPRFILKVDELQLINFPPIEPEKVTTMLEQIETHPLTQYEAYYDERYTGGLGSVSKTYAWVHFLLTNNIGVLQPIPVGDERHLVTVAILESFARDVRDAGSEFMVVHFPNSLTVQSYLTMESVPHQYILDEVSTFAPVLQSEVAFDSNDSRYWAIGGHYSHAGNQLVAEHSANALVACLADGSCLPPRFQDGARFLSEN